MEEYSRAIARCAAAQISDAAGFEAVQESALDMVSELMLRFVSEIGAASHSYAELAGRTDTNVFDVLHALQELGMDLEQLRDHIDTEAENPFNHPLPSYPIQTAPKRAPAFREKGEEPPEHVPAFLPAFPDERTYKETPVYASRNASREEIRRQQVRGRKDAGQALEKLSQRMAPRAPVNYAAAEPSRWGHIPGGAEAHTDGGINPFLATPIWEEGVLAGGNAAASAGDGGDAVPEVGLSARLVREAAKGAGEVDGDDVPSKKKSRTKANAPQLPINWASTMDKTSLAIAIGKSKKNSTLPDPSKHPSEEAKKNEYMHVKVLMSKGANSMYEETEEKEK